MIDWIHIVRNTRRKALQELVVELFTLNNRDHCWDPVGSIDTDGMLRIVEVIADGKQTMESKRAAKLMFKLRRQRI